MKKEMTLKTKKWMGYDFNNPAEKYSYTERALEKAFMEFLRDWKKDVVYLLKDSDWKINRVLPNHFTFFVFLRNEKEDKWASASVSDVRVWKEEWYNSIMVRSAKDAKDYGGRNKYTTLPNLAKALGEL